MQDDDLWTDWIEHTGDECPVHSDTAVKVRIRCGSTPIRSYKASDWRWTFLDVDHDITHYKVLKKDLQDTPESEIGTLAKRLTNAEAKLEKLEQLYQLHQESAKTNEEETPAVQEKDQKEPDDYWIDFSKFKPEDDVVVDVICPLGGGYVAYFSCVGEDNYVVCTTFAPSLSGEMIDDFDLLPSSKIRISSKNPWKPWFGGERPVPDDCMVEVRLRNGDTDESQAWSYDWSVTMHDGDIIAYRLLESDWQDIEGNVYRGEE